SVFVFIIFFTFVIINGFRSLRLRSFHLDRKEGNYTERFSRLFYSRNNWFNSGLTFFVFFGRDTSASSAVSSPSSRRCFPVRRRLSILSIGTVLPVASTCC